MEKITLETETLYAAFINACNHIIVQREQLNAINLFPVADGDTGDNMAATAMAVINNSELQPTLNATLQSMSNAAISGARGNSGMIFSQFFNGLVDYVPKTEQLTTKSFSQLITNAIQSVRAAILNPVEGTIITVMDAWAATSSQLAHSHRCFIKLLNYSLTTVNEAVQSTTTTLEVLKKAQVVDAGALGFYHFIYGFADFLANPREVLKKKEPLVLNNVEHSFSQHDAPPSHRYCTEALLANESIDKKQLKQILDAHGDSVVISGNQKLCRFHIHSNHPEKIFTKLNALGTITQPKVDDMLRQFEINHQRKHRIALVTDTSANLPQDMLDRYQIHLIPLNLYMDEHHLLDKYCVTPDSFYNGLALLKDYPKTSLPNPALIKEKMTHLSNHYEDVLILSLSKELSGTHDAIVKSVEHRANIHVINSKQTAGSLGLLVQYAAKCIEEGMKIDAIIDALHTKSKKIHAYILIDQFDSLVRSGRLSKAKSWVAQLAHIKPIVTLNEQGQAILYDKAFSHQKGIDKIIHFVEQLKEGHQVEAYNIIHADAPEFAQQFADQATQALGQAPDFIDTASTVIGLHAGKGSVAISFMLQ